MANPVSVNLDEEHVRKLDEIAKRLGMPNRSYALRAIIDQVRDAELVIHFTKLRIVKAETMAAIGCFLTSFSILTMWAF